MWPGYSHVSKPLCGNKISCMDAAVVTWEPAASLGILGKSLLWQRKQASIQISNISDSWVAINLIKLSNNSVAVCCVWFYLVLLIVRLFLCGCCGTIRFLVYLCRSMVFNCWPVCRCSGVRACFRQQVCECVCCCSCWLFFCEMHIDLSFGPGV